ncbi:MAG: hypothetical protein K2O52_07710 [Oscillospiraceae bacterium]|nr:hypothetical protein [Oscillospiraceae bacterium]MDE7094781.1 hypothetical protein [Oscillospiraceae bacterium]
MLEILEQKNLDCYQEIIKKLEISGQAELHISEAKEEKLVKGYIIYAYEPEQVLIYAVADNNDWNQCDGLVRSVLFKAELKGLQKAVFLVQDMQMQDRLVKLGFMKNNQKTLENIMEVMENCKKCKENPANT